MDFSQILQLLNARGSQNPNEINEALTVETNLLESDPLNYFIALANVIVADGIDKVLVSRAMITIKVAIDKVRAKGTDRTDTISIYENAQSGILQALTEKAFAYASILPNESGNLLFSILKEFIINDNPNSTQILSAVCSFWESNKTETITLAIATTFEALSLDLFLKEQVLYQPIMTFIIESLYITTYTAETQLKILSALLHMISSIEDIINDDSNRVIIYQVVASKMAIPQLKPICYSIYGKIARFGYQHFSEIADQIITSANEYLNTPNITAVEQCAICHFFRSLAKAELELKQNEEETYGIVEQVFPAIFMNVATIAATDNNPDVVENETRTPSSEAANLLMIMMQACPDVSVPIVVEFITENISQESIGAKVLSYYMAYTVVSYMSTDDVGQFTVSVIQQAAQDIQEGIPRVVEAALIALTEIVIYFVKNNSYEVLHEPVSSLIPAVCEYIATMPEIAPSGIEFVLQMAEQKTHFAFTTQIFNRFIGIFETDDSNHVLAVSTFLAKLIELAANTDELIAFVPTVVNLVASIRTNEIFNRNSGEIFILLDSLMRRCYKSFEEHAQMLIETLTAEFIATGQSESVCVATLSDVVCRVLYSQGYREMQEHFGELFANMCAYLLQRVGSLSDVTDGSISTQRFFEAKGIILPFLPMIVETIHNSLPEHRYFADCFEQIIALVIYFIKSSYMDSFGKAGGVEIIKLINQFILEDEQFATDSAGVFNNLAALYTSLLEVAPENCAQWLPAMLALLGRASPAIEWAESYEIKEAVLIQLCTLLTGICGIFREDGANAIREVCEQNEAFLAVLLEFRNIEKIISNTRSLFETLGIPMGDEEEDQN